MPSKRTTTATPEPPEEPTANALSIDRIDVETLHIPIIGTRPLIMDRFSEKAKRQLLDAQQGRRRPKERRDPQADYEASLYRLPGNRYGVPSASFKQAIVGAARFYGKSVTMTSLRLMVWLGGEPSEQDGQDLIEITGEPKMREDYVRPTGSGADLRFRAEFADWSAVLPVSYVMSSLQRQSVVSLVDAAGMGIGVGNWRPERSGSFGTFRIDDAREIEVQR